MRQVPPVTFLEVALESLQNPDPDRKVALKELHALGTFRLSKLLPAPTYRFTQFEKGYLLGLEVARLLDEAMQVPKEAKLPGPGDQS